MEEIIKVSQNSKSKANDEMVKLEQNMADISSLISNINSNIEIALNEE
jgi:predicted  nucleic acid-binding Zn-ribbon protein